MHWPTIIAATLFGATALASPLATPPTTVPTTPTPDACASGPTVFQIKDFTTRKYDGVNVNTVFFNIAATNGGTLDFLCVAYDPATGTATENFESGKVYSCGEFSFFSFSYYVPTQELQVFQNISTDLTIAGRLITGDPICRAGGATINDLICSIPSIIGVYIVLLPVEAL